MWPLAGVSSQERLLPKRPYAKRRKKPTTTLCWKPLLWQREQPGEYREFAFLVTLFSGELALGGPELATQTLENQHIFQWQPLDELSQIDLFPGPVTAGHVARIRELAHSFT